MCLMRKEFEVSVEELRYLCLKCTQPECQTEIVLDMNATRVHMGVTCPQTLGQRSGEFLVH